MKVFVDENIPRITVETLRQLNFDVCDIRGTDQEGMSDNEVWEKSQKENRLLITTDKVFAQYRNHTHNGILIVLLKGPNYKKIHERVMNALNQFSADDWSGLLVVVRDTVQSHWRVKSVRL